MQTFTNTAGYSRRAERQPACAHRRHHEPSRPRSRSGMRLGNAIATPVLQNGVAAHCVSGSRQSGNGIKYTDVAVPPVLRQHRRACTTTSSAGGNGGYSPTVTDGFIRMPGGSIPNNGFLTVQFNVTPNCTSGTYLVSTDAGHERDEPAIRHESVGIDDRWLPHDRRRAREPVRHEDRLSRSRHRSEAALTYTIDVNNAGPIRRPPSRSSTRCPPERRSSARRAPTGPVTTHPGP